MGLVVGALKLILRCLILTEPCRRTPPVTPPASRKSPSTAERLFGNKEQFQGSENTQ